MNCRGKKRENSLEGGITKNRKTKLKSEDSEDR